MPSLATTALSWSELEPFAAAFSRSDPIQGPASSQALLRLFGQPDDAVRVTLYRDHHAWCPYCQKVWLWLEERGIPYRVRKVAMVCYGEKESWYRRLVPSGMLPAVEIDGRLITESDRILAELERSFGPLEVSLQEAAVRGLRELERELFRAWCLWLCQPPRDAAEAERFAVPFLRLSDRLEQELDQGPGPFLLGDFSAADLVFVPFLERMNASLAYYKGHLLRHRHPALDRWFAALEQRPAYLGCQGDFHTHAHDLPPQLGSCVASGQAEQRRLAQRIDQGPWPILGEAEPDPETSRSEPITAPAEALGRVLRHRAVLLRRNPAGEEGFDAPLRAALTHLACAADCPPPPGSAAALRHLRDRISVPRDMSLHAARRLRTALEHTASLDPATPTAQPQPIPQRDRRDQDPQPFLLAAEQRRSA